MNAYLVQEDGDVRVWIAPTMQRALDLAWHGHVKDNEIDIHEDLDAEREAYEVDILQSCTLIAPVANP